MWARYRTRILDTAEQGQQIQMSLLPQRESPARSKKSFSVTPLSIVAQSESCHRRQARVFLRLGALWETKGRWV